MTGDGGLAKAESYAKPVARSACRLVCVALAASTLAGCAALRLEAPKIAVSRVEVDRLTPTDARFNVFVAISNPNDRPIAVESIDANLRIEDVVIGTAQLAEAVRLPARGDTTARLVARADLPSSLRAAAQVASRAQVEGPAFAGIRYAVDGRAVIDGGSIYPFARKGEIAWPPR